MMVNENKDEIGRVEDFIVDFITEKWIQLDFS